MRLTFEVLLDEPEIGRIVRIGRWTLTTYPDGHGEWEWEAKHEQAARQPREISGGPAKREVAEDLRKASANGVSRFSKVSRVPSIPRVVKPHPWAVFEPDKAS